jgi:hypothetical protein
MSLVLFDESCIGFVKLGAQIVYDSLQLTFPLPKAREGGHG